MLTPSDFTPVFNNPVVAASPAFTVLAKPNDRNRARLGLTIAKKKIKKAAGRNRVKRLIRESFRHHQHQLPDVDLVIMAKNGTAEFDNAELTKQLAKLWRKITQRCNERS